ncbi:MAG: hypothetical protein M3323_06155 [Actinomycetota bacterium]|nr:hypothetical protein [Actinomycetota bacterium]
MGRRVSATTAAMAVVVALFALLLATVPAAAHHKDEHLQGGNGSEASQDAKDNDGDADSDSGTAYTEDDDTNDGNTPNNVPDDGDNAHPSGKDRSVENGGSGNQGSSESDPDDDGRGPDRSNGGPDKPNGSGGADKADQDGNNGCGNDDDFEDDNEGWCGKPPKPAQAVTPAGPCDADATMPGTQPCLDAGVLPTEPCVDDETMAEGAEECEDDDVLGGLIARPSTPETADEGPEVLGERLSQPVAGAAAEAAERGAAFLGQPLPFTGSALLSFAAIAVGLLLAGAGILASRRSAR